MRCPELLRRTRRQPPGPSAQLAGPGVESGGLCREGHPQLAGTATSQAAAGQRCSGRRIRGAGGWVTRPCDRRRTLPAHKRRRSGAEKERSLLPKRAQLRKGPSDTDRQQRDTRRSGRPSDTDGDSSRSPAREPCTRSPPWGLSTALCGGERISSPRVMGKPRHGRNPGSQEAYLSPGSS